MESRKIVPMSLFAGNDGDIDVENRLVDTVGEGKGGMNWDSSVETYTLPYVKWKASGNLLYDPGSPNPVLFDRLEGWDRAGGRLKREETCVC